MTAGISIETAIQTAALKAKVTPEQARAAIVASLGLLKKHAKAGTLAPVWAALPGAEALARSDEAKPPKGGLFAGVLKAAGGVSGAVIGDAMGMMDRLKALGLERVDIKPLLRSIREQARTATGRDPVGDAVRSVPGVGPLLGE